jgi:hypothetical protein
VRVHVRPRVQLAAVPGWLACTLVCHGTCLDLCQQVVQVAAVSHLDRVDGELPVAFVYPRHRIIGAPTKRTQQARAALRLERIRPQAVRQAAQADSAGGEAEFCLSARAPAQGKKCWLFCVREAERLSACRFVCLSVCRGHRRCLSRQRAPQHVRQVARRQKVDSADAD